MYLMICYKERIIRIKYFTFLFSLKLLKNFPFRSIQCKGKNSCNLFIYVKKKIECVALNK